MDLADLGVEVIVLQLFYCHIPLVCSSNRYLVFIVDLGAAYGTAKSGVGIASMGILHPSEVMKNIIPVIMAGILGIYGLIVATILTGKSMFLCTSFPAFLYLTSYSFFSRPPCPW